MYQTRQIPYGSGMKYYLESFLREDFIQFGIVLRTDETGAIKSLSFNSHNLGTVDIESDRTVQCFRWEDEEEAASLSPAVKHYPTITGVREHDRAFTGAVVSEVLERIGNEYLRKLLSDFFIVRQTEILKPEELPTRENDRPGPPIGPHHTGESETHDGNDSGHKIEAPTENPVGVPTKEIPPEPGSITVELRPMTIEALPEEPTKSQNDYTRTLQQLAERITRFNIWRWNFDFLLGASLLALIAGLLFTAGDPRQFWQGLPAAVYCNQKTGACIHLQQNETGKSPVVITERFYQGILREQTKIPTTEPAPGFLVSIPAAVSAGKHPRHCWVVKPDALLGAPCYLNGSSYGDDFITVEQGPESLQCYHGHDRGPRKTECFPGINAAYPWSKYSIQAAGQK